MRELTAAFGKSGRAMRESGAVANIATDEMGYIYVSDRLRSAVLVFDRDLRFQTEFGYPGNQPSIAEAIWRREILGIPAVTTKKLNRITMR